MKTIDPKYTQTPASPLDKIAKVFQFRDIATHDDIRRGKVIRSQLAELRAKGFINQTGKYFFLTPLAQRTLFTTPEPQKKRKTECLTK